MTNPKDTIAALVGRMFRHIEHGDAEHRAWLYRELVSFFETERQIAEALGCWQDIRTAPKDGTTVDLWSPKYVRFTGCVWTKLYKRNDYQWFQYGTDGYEIEPTHWMPLPAPPNAIEAGTYKGDE